MKQTCIYARCPRGLCVLMGLIVIFAGSGCTTWRFSVMLRSTEDTNQGRPLQVLVRSVAAERYREETYADLAKLVTTPDKTVLRSLILEPSDKRRLWLSAPSDTPVALYFLFGSTTGSWKMLLPPPLPWSVQIPLGRTGVLVPAVKECRLGRGLP
ncbi:MAG TPA: hypothetical protein PLY80_02530 [Pseudomonadota bacterium]|nr:hypothetical protein [Pseudomonadota bacterium]